MPGIPTSTKVRFVCVNSSFLLLHTKCTYAKHDQFTSLSYIVNMCRDREGSVESCADYMQVSKGQTLKLFYLEHLKLLQFVQMRFHQTSRQLG